METKFYLKIISKNSFEKFLKTYSGKYPDSGHPEDLGK